MVGNIKISVECLNNRVTAVKEELVESKDEMLKIEEIWKKLITY